MGTPARGASDQIPGRLARASRRLGGPSRPDCFVPRYDAPVGVYPQLGEVPVGANPTDHSSGNRVSSRPGDNVSTARSSGEGGERNAIPTRSGSSDNAILGLPSRTSGGRCTNNRIGPT